MVFTGQQVTVGGAKQEEASALEPSPYLDVFEPPPRFGAGTAIKKNTFFLYGGLYEDGEKQLTLDDF